MSSLLDMSLDDIAKSARSEKRPSSRGPVRGGNKPQQRQQQQSGKAPSGGNRQRSGGNKPYGRSSSNGNRRPSGGAEADSWSHDKFEGGRNNGKQQQRSNSNGPRRLESGAKVSISNLNWEVTEANLKELFSEVGVVRRAHIDFDRAGRSLGQGEIVFESRAAADAAVREFNGALLDGMALKLSIVSSSQPQQQQQKPRQENSKPRQDNSTPRQARQEKPKQQKPKQDKPKQEKRAAPAKKSAADLDAELDAYLGGGNDDSAAAAASADESA